MRRNRLLAWTAGRGRLRVLLLALVALGACGIALAAYGTHLLRGLEGSTVDTRFSIRGKEKPPSNIVIVAIDDRTVANLDLQFPFPRNVQAKVLNRILAQNPKAVTWDIVFEQKSSIFQNGTSLGLSSAQ